MSNQLRIFVTEFVSPIKAIGSRFGYVANDNYASFYEDGFSSWEDFFSRYRTPRELVETILEQPGFEDLTLDSSSTDEEPMIEDMAPICIEGFLPKFLLDSPEATPSEGPTGP